MNKGFGAHIFRGILILFLQLIIFKQLQFGESFLRFAHVLLYPLIIILLPIRVSRNFLLLLSFAIGIILDIFYNSIGVHTSALVFTAFVRPFVLQILEPRGGYNVNISPTRHHLGMAWFIRYSSILLFIHCLFYFSVESFSFVYIQDIILGTILSFIITSFFILMFQFITNPK